MLGALGHLIEEIRIRYGLDYAGSRLDVLTAGLAGLDPDIQEAALQLVRADRGKLAEFVGSITNSETYFFRHAEQFSALGVLIQRQWSQHPTPTYRAWCAGCSTGEEPLSVSAVLYDVGILTPNSPSATVLATDINPSALRVAQNARYTEWSFRGVLTEQRERYFIREGTHYRPRPSLGERVTFRRHNLLDPPPEPVPFDLVVCRNVLIYFDGAQFERAVNQLALAVAPGGILVLGPVESAAAKLPDFDVLHPGACIVYRKRHAFREAFVPRGWTSASAAGAEPVAPRPALPAPSRPSQPRLVVRPLASPPPPTVRPSAPGAAPSAHTPRLPPASDDFSAMLAYAGVLADQGRLAEARAVADTLFRKHGEHGELRILSALILLEEDRRDEAAAELELAVASQPDLAMAHYLLGSILDTSGARAQAEASYRRALAALGEKPPLQPVPGGGGLTVDALVATLTHMLGLSKEVHR